MTTAGSVLSLASTFLCAAGEAPVAFVTYMRPFVPALLGLLCAVVIEAGSHWAGRSVRANWWFAMAFGSLAVVLLIWQSWCHAVPMTVLADLPDAEGIQFRLSLVAFGGGVVVCILGMVYAGVRLVVDCIPFSGIFPAVVRLLPAPAIPVLLVWQVLDAVRLFEGLAFRLFP